MKKRIAEFNLDYSFHLWKKQHNCTPNLSFLLNIFNGSDSFDRATGLIFSGDAAQAASTYCIKEKESFNLLCWGCCSYTRCDKLLSLFVNNSAASANGLLDRFTQKPAIHCDLAGCIY